MTTDGFRVVNHAMFKVQAADEMDTSGEWWQQGEGRPVCLLMPAGSDPSNHSLLVQAGHDQPAVRLRGCENVTVRGVHFFAAHIAVEAAEVAVDGGGRAVLGKNVGVEDAKFEHFRGQIILRPGWLRNSVMRFATNERTCGNGCSNVIVRGTMGKGLPSLPCHFDNNLLTHSQTGVEVRPVCLPPFVALSSRRTVAVVDPDLPQPLRPQAGTLFSG